MPDQKVSRKRKERLVRHHVLLLQHGGGKIDRPLVETLQAKLDAKVKTPPGQTELCLWVESPGGDPNAAYKLFLELRSRCTRLTAVVPDYAKSAATLLLLGVDTIYMAVAAELGPLDVQVGHPDREGEIVSGLDISDSLDFLGKTAIKMIASGGAALIDVTKLPRSAVLKDMCSFAATFLQPLMTKLDPHLVHRAVNPTSGRRAVREAHARSTEARPWPAAKRS